MAVRRKAVLKVFPIGMSCYVIGCLLHRRDACDPFLEMTGFRGTLPPPPVLWNQRFSGKIKNNL